MSREIHIDDLRQPRHTPKQRQALDWVESQTVAFSRDSLLAEARERTGLSDFGAEDFIERLDRLVDEWGGDDGLSNLGRLSLRNKLVQHLSSRLLIEDCFKRHPEIHDIPIERPIIVAGLPRSGTTHLLNLMAADSRLRSLPLWESYEPLPLPGEAASGGRNDPRYARCEQAWQMMQAMTPHLAAMHPMNPDHIHEELELMGPNIASYNYEWLSPCPRWRDAYYAEDQTPHYQYMKKVLRLLLWRQGPKRPRRWVLKCPQHLEQLAVLRAVFPDATVAITHRDPVAVIQSVVTMLAYGQRMNRHAVEADALIAYWSDRVEHLLRACVRDRSLWSDEQSIDVPFHRFMANDLAMVGRIYVRADLELTDNARAELQAYGDAHPRGKDGRVIYQLERDFGVSPAALRERFQFYFDAFDVRAEV